MTRQTKVITTVTFIIAVVAAVITGGFLYFSGFNINETKYIYIDTDDTIDSVRCKIVETAEPSCISSFDIFAKVLSYDKNIRTGRYEVNDSMTMMQLVRHLRNHNEKPVMLVVPALIRTMPDMAGRLAKGLMLDSAEMAETLTNNEKLAEIGYTKESIYSLFIPNTYEVYWDVSVDNLLKRMIKEHDSFWNDERKGKLKEVSEYAGMEMDEVAVATLASIVDSETANNGEKANIAGLYLNRLRINMPLQSDPTVKYALQDFGLRRILHEHLTVESPYNTYRNEGLPPGPICVPTMSGLDAVLNHAHNDYIYMCAKEDFSGTHNFAVSYAEHLQNAKKYARALDARGIK